MRATLALLQSAPQAPLLVAARKQLGDAKRNKGGALGQAMETLNEAIALAEAGGDKNKIDQKINATIANVQNGMGNAK